MTLFQSLDEGVAVEELLGLSEPYKTEIMGKTRIWLKN